MANNIPPILSKTELNPDNIFEGSDKTWKAMTNVSKLLMKISSK